LLWLLCVLGYFNPYLEDLFWSISEKKRVKNSKKNK
jgi:hypothetical protein